MHVAAPMHPAGWPGAIGAIQCSFVLLISHPYQKAFLLLVMSHVPPNHVSFLSPPSYILNSDLSA